MSRLVIVGSANADHVMEFSHLPEPGQTLMSRSYRLEHGGKGANQAVAVARLVQPGTRVDFICHLGDDAIADTMIKSWLDDGIHPQGLKKVPEMATGSAMIFIGDGGENCIGVAAGANASLEPADVHCHQDLFEGASYLLAQLETPLESVKAALQLAKQQDTVTILNPAPASTLADDVLALVDIITPNETEAEALTGIKVEDEAGAAKAAAALQAKGVGAVVITLGSRGAYVRHPEFEGLVPSYPVKVLDTVAAGDTFNGALMVALSEGLAMEQAVDFANKAASIAVTRHGAQRGTPYRREL